MSHPTFHLWVWHAWLGICWNDSPYPKSCSKCHKMPRSNFSFLGVICLVGGMLKWPTLTLKVVQNVITCLDPTFHFWVWLAWLGYAENPPPQPKKLFQPENQNVIEFLPRLLTSFKGYWLPWQAIKFLHRQMTSLEGCWGICRLLNSCQICLQHCCSPSHQP